MPENIIQMLLGLCQAWGCDHFSGDPVPVPNNSLGEKLSPDLHPRSLLTQIQAISLVMRMKRLVLVFTRILKGVCKEKQNEISGKKIGER